MKLPPDVTDLLREFAAAEVRYLLIGGYAVAVHGEPRFTKGVGLWLAGDAPNVARARDALVRFGAPHSTIDAWLETEGLDVAWMGQPPVRIDLMKQVPGGDFDAAYGRRLVAAEGDLAIDVIGRADLVSLKKASGRPQDLLDVSALESLGELP